MSILVNKNTRVMVQGITGRMGRFHCEQMMAYGTRVVAGVTPGRGGEHVHGVPVYNTVAEAMQTTPADATLVTVAPPYAADAIMEAAEAGVRLAVSITDGIPAQDMIKVKRYMRRYKEEQSMRLLGPNCSGVISPDQCLLGIMPGSIFTQGHVGLVSRSGTLGYEAAAQMQSFGIGISTSVGIGGDPICGSSFVDILKMFNEDEDTHLVAMVGEIGGSQESEAAEFIQSSMSKPVVAYVAGVSAPHRKAMGHAGAIISAFGESAHEKVRVLKEVGAVIASTPSQIGHTVAQVMNSGQLES